jgi:hypothetical protein
MSVTATTHDQHVIKFMVKTPYINDQIELHLQRSKSKITTSKLIEVMDYKINHALQQKSRDLVTNTSQLETLLASQSMKINELENQIDKIWVAHTLRINALEIQTTCLKQANDVVQSKFYDLIRTVPIMTGIRTKDSKKKITSLPLFKNIMSTEKELRLMYRDGDGYYIDDVYKVESFELGRFKFMTDLTGVVFSGCPFRDLTFLPIIASLNVIHLENMNHLRSVEHLNKFPNLTRITIMGSSSYIEDMKSLVKCPSLNVLRIPDVYEYRGVSSQKFKTTFD